MVTTSQIPSGVDQIPFNALTPSVGWLDSIKKIVALVLSKSFFAGYDPLSTEASLNKTTQLITDHQAIRLSCNNAAGEALEVLSLCKDRGGSKGVVVFAETTSYQDRLEKNIPHQYEYFLNCGFEVVVWNPSISGFTNREYANDLSCVLKEMQKLRGEKVPLIVKAHCASVEPTISAATELSKQNSVVLILDRGYADAAELARSTTVFGAIPFINEVIHEQFTCDGTNKLRQFNGEIIWVSPEDPTADQMMYWPKTGENLTHKMQQMRPSEWIRLGVNSDHWSHWDKDDYKAMTQTLIKMQLLQKAPQIPEAPARKTVPFCKRVIMPYALTKTWF